MTIERSGVKAPVLPREAVPVPELGGEVIVRGLLLSEQMAVQALMVRDGAPRDGESEEQAVIRAKTQRVASVLARTVVLADEQPLYTAAEWDVFGARHPAAAIALFKVAERLNGDDAEAAAGN